MEAVGEHAAAQPEHPVHGSCEPRAERLHAARQIPRARGLDDRVQVIALNRVVHDAEAPALARCAERAFELGDEAFRP